MKSQPPKPDDFAFRVFAPVLVDPARYNVAPYNPKTISEDDLVSLKQGILTFGFVGTMVLQLRSERYGADVLVDGHQRLKAVREVAAETGKPIPRLPTIELDIDDRTAKKLNVALERVRGDISPRLLSELLADIQSEQPIAPEEQRLMGFHDTDEFLKLLHLGDPPQMGSGGEESPAFGRSLTLSLAFTDLRKRDALKAKLDELAAQAQTSTGEIVWEMFSSPKRREHAPAKKRKK